MLYRLYRPAIEQAYAAIAFLVDAGYDLNRVINHAREDNTKLRGPLRERLTRIGSNGVDLDATFSALLKDFNDQLTHSDSRGSSDGDLIDLIVETLQLPYASNRLSGDTLDSLRHAILLPNELGGMRARLEAAETSCSTCGHAIHDDEIMSFRRTAGGLSAICYHCHVPTLITCPVCRTNRAEVTKAAPNGLSPCAKCKEAAKQKGVKKAPDGAEVEAALTTREQAENEVGRRRRTAAANFQEGGRPLLVPPAFVGGGRGGGAAVPPAPPPRGTSPLPTVWPTSNTTTVQGMPNTNWVEQRFTSNDPNFEEVFRAFTGPAQPPTPPPGGRNETE